MQCYAPAAPGTPGAPHQLPPAPTAPERQPGGRPSAPGSRHRSARCPAAAPAGCEGCPPGAHPGPAQMPPGHGPSRVWAPCARLKRACAVSSVGPRPCAQRHQAAMLLLLWDSGPPAHAQAGRRLLQQLGQALRLGAALHWQLCAAAVHQAPAGLLPGPAEQRAAPLPRAARPSDLHILHAPLRHQLFCGLRRGRWLWVAQQDADKGQA